MRRDETGSFGPILLSRRRASVVPRPAPAFTWISDGRVIYSCWHLYESVLPAQFDRSLVLMSKSIGIDHMHNTVGMANVFTRKNTHQDHLRVFVREHDLPKVIVL